MTIRLVGLIAGILLIIIGISGRRRARFSRGDLFLWMGFGCIAGLLSLDPDVVNTLASLLRLENRLFAVLVASVGILGAVSLRQRGRQQRLESQFGDLVRNIAIREFRIKSDHPAHKRSIAIVIAAYNEEQAIGGVVNELPKMVEGLRVDPIIVVDGSNDDTEGVVRRAGYSVATHPVNRGQGDALRTGFAIALERGNDIVVTMDADGQHRPDELHLLIKPIVEAKADYVQGSRFLGNYDDAGSARGRGVMLFSKLINLLTSASITDCANGYRAIQSEGLAQLRLEEDRFSAAEIIMEAAGKGLRMMEVPVHIRARSHGKSKKPRQLGYPLGYLRTIFSVWLRS